MKSRTIPFVCALLNILGYIAYTLTQHDGCPETSPFWMEHIVLPIVAVAWVILVMGAILDGIITFSGGGME